MRQLPLIAIVIVNYKGIADTLECLESLRFLDEARYFTIVVDNASGGNEAEQIAKMYADVTVLAESENLGFTGGNNVGMRLAMDRAADLIFLLNNDTTVLPDTLTKLSQYMELEPRAGIAGACMVYYDRPTEVAAVGARVDYKGRCFNWHEHKQVPDVEQIPPLDVDFVHGSGMLIRRTTIEKIGYLDDRFFLNYEEVDYCARARAAGFYVRAVPAAKYLHKIGRSIGLGSPMAQYYMTRNRLLYLRNRHAWAGLSVSLFLTLVRCVTTRNPVQRRVERRAVRDFSFGRFGAADLF